MNRRLHRLIVVAVLCLLALLAGGCGTMQTDLTLYSGDAWQMTATLTVPAQVLAMSDSAQIKQSLDEAVAESRAGGANASWRQTSPDKSGNVSYVIELNGTGFGKPFSNDFVASPVTFNGRQALRVSPAAGSSLLNSSLSGSALRIHGAEILDTNGKRIDRQTAGWDYASSSAYAILVPQSALSRFNWLYLIGAVLGIAVVGGGVTAYRRSRRSGFQMVAQAPALPAQSDWGAPAATPPAYRGPATVRAELEPGAAPDAAAPGGPDAVSAAVFCPACGAAVALGSRFCMHCGAAIPPRS